MPRPVLPRPPLARSALTLGLTLLMACAALTALGGQPGGWVSELRSRLWPPAPVPRTVPAPTPEFSLLTPAAPVPQVALLAPPLPLPVVVHAPLDSFALRAGSSVQLRQVWMGDDRVALLTGGRPVSRHVLWRSSVGEFVRNSGAVAGVNGTFFKDAAIASNDSNMLGPLLTPNGRFLSETDQRLLKKISGRPLVGWSRQRLLLTEFEPGRMNRRPQMQALLPGMTDAFLAGGWLVRGGRALNTVQMMRHAPKDAQEVRPRVFFGVTAGGLVIAGATVTPVSSTRLAQIAQTAGAQEAVLLDSGYSTSLIYGSRVLAVGHSTRKVVSRPVPHAIVFMNPAVADVP